MSNLKKYSKVAIVSAKPFEPGDEHGFDGRENGTKTPVLATLEGIMRGQFYENYICFGVEGESWLVRKDIFERTYKEVPQSDGLDTTDIPLQWIEIDPFRDESWPVVSDERQSLLLLSEQGNAVWVDKIIRCEGWDKVQVTASYPDGENGRKTVQLIVSHWCDFSKTSRFLNKTNR